MPSIALLHLLLPATAILAATVSARERRSRAAPCTPVLHGVSRHRWPEPASDRAAVADTPERYPVETLQEALAEGIVTGHPTMPEFRFEPDQINDFLTFLKSLE